MNNKIEVIGIDHGWSNIKTSSPRPLNSVMDSVPDWAKDPEGKWMVAYQQRSCGMPALMLVIGILIFRCVMKEEKQRPGEKA